MIDASPESKTQKRCVVILGAGASVPFGVPVLNDLYLPIANRSDSTELQQNAQKAYNYLKCEKSFDEELDKIYTRTNELLKDKNNLETILSIVRVQEFLEIIPDYLRALFIPDSLRLLFVGTFGDIENIEEIRKFKKKLYIYLKKCVYDDKSSRPGPTNPNSLNGFFKYCEDMPTTWCTFNWDCILESSFFYYKKQKGSGKTSMKLHGELHKNGKFKNYPQNCSQSDLLLKLHGGVNWWWDNQIAGFEYSYPNGSGNPSTPHIDNYWKEFEADSNSPETREPVILEPSAYKYQESKIYGLLKPQWDEFECALKNANAIIIIGYSLPELDPQVKEYLKKAKTTAKVAVFDLENSDVYEKYEGIFGKNRVSPFPCSYGKDSDSEIDEKLKRVYDPAKP